MCCCVSSFSLSVTVALREQGRRYSLSRSVHCVWTSENSLLSHSFLSHLVSPRIPSHTTFYPPCAIVVSLFVVDVDDDNHCFRCVANQREIRFSSSVVFSASLSSLHLPISLHVLSVSLQNEFELLIFVI